MDAERLIVAEVMRVTGAPSKTAWGVVRRMRLIKKYGAEHCLKTMATFSAREFHARNIPILMGTLKKTFKPDYTTMQLSPSVRSFLND